MPDDKKAAAIGAGVGLTAGALAVLLSSRKVSAEGLVSLDESAMQALLSILQHSENIDGDTTELIATANRIATALGVPAVLENPSDITAFTVFTTANAPMRLPDRAVPYKMELVVKALHINTGVIMVAPSQAAARNPNGSYWLIASDHVEYEIRNANHIWICPHPTLGIIGDGVTCTVEQEASH